MAQNERVRQWITPLVTVTLAAVTLAVYPWMAKQLNPVVYVQVLAASLGSAVLPLCNRFFGTQVPASVNVMVAAHIVCASFLGSALGFYRLVPVWDLLMHGFFGGECAVILYVLLRRYQAAVGYTVLWWLIGLSVMGCAALWEIFEYVSDLLLSGDAQRVKESLAAGRSPVGDTMTDLIVTVFGIAVVWAAWFVYRWWRKKARV